MKHLKKQVTIGASLDHNLCYIYALSENANSNLTGSEMDATDVLP